MLLKCQSFPVSWLRWVPRAESRLTGTLLMKEINDLSTRLLSAPEAFRYVLRKERIRWRKRMDGTCQKHMVWGVEKEN